jgi:hypothetical protein
VPVAELQPPAPQGVSLSAMHVPESEQAAEVVPLQWLPLVKPLVEQ